MDALVLVLLASLTVLFAVVTAFGIVLMGLLVQFLADILTSNNNNQKRKQD